MRVENPKLVVEPGAGRTGKLAMVAYQFQQEYWVEETLCCGIQFVIYISMAAGEVVGSQAGLPSV